MNCQLCLTVAIYIRVLYGSNLLSNLNTIMVSNYFVIFTSCFIETTTPSIKDIFNLTSHPRLICNYHENLVQIRRKHVNRHFSSLYTVEEQKSENWDHYWKCILFDILHWWHIFYHKYCFLITKYRTWLSNRIIQAR